MACSFLGCLFFFIPPIFMPPKLRYARAGLECPLPSPRNFFVVTFQNDWDHARASVTTSLVARKVLGKEDEVDKS